jgi:hypothetical protein
VEQIRHSRAEDALQQALIQGGGAWASAVQKAHAQADTKAAKLVTELRQLEARRGELRSLELWLDQLVRSGRPPGRLRPIGGTTSLADPRNAGEQVRAEELLAVLEAYVHSSTVEARHEQAAERQRREDEHRAAAEEIRALRAQHPPLSA